VADINRIKDEIAQDEVAQAVPINQKNGEPYLAPDGSPCTVSVLGSDAKRVQAARDTIQRRMLRARRVKLDPADLRANRIDLAAAAVTGWYGWTAGDVEFPCTPENIRALLSSEHVLEQVETGITGHADFFVTASPI
jgi:hypothetical protein